jgi:hypothetical protein
MRPLSFALFSWMLVVSGLAQEINGVVTGIEGAAEVQLPGSSEFVPLTEQQVLPLGSIIVTEADSAVFLSGVSGSIIKVEEASELSIRELGVETVSSAAPVQKSLFEVMKGRMSYSFDEFPENGSYFKIKTAGAVAGARGGSGYVTSDGELGAVAGTMEAVSITGEKIPVETGMAVQTNTEGHPILKRSLRQTAKGGQYSESVLQLASLGVKKGRLKPAELNLVKQRMQGMGVLPDKMQEIMQRPLRPKRIPARWKNRVSPEVRKNWNQKSPEQKKEALSRVRKHPQKKAQ